MVRKALLREGIMVSREIESNPFIEIKEQKIKLHYLDRPSQAINSIEELLMILDL